MKTLTPCKEFRARGRKSLKDNWGKAIIITLIFIIISYLLNVPTTLSTYLLDTYNINSTSLFYFMDLIFNTSLIIFLMISAILTIGITPVLSLGYSLFFIKLYKGETAEVSDLFKRFKYFFKALGLFLLIGIKIFLWSLLLVIPGIVASFNYSMAYFIMAENPDVGIVEAIEMSKKLMKGNKMKLFLLELSFIGWVIVSIITFGIATLFVVPYITSAQIHFYKEISSGEIEIPATERKMNTEELNTPVEEKEVITQEEETIAEEKEVPTQEEETHIEEENE